MGHFFYELRNKFLRDNPELNEIDSESKKLYGDWEGTIGRWSRKYFPILSVASWWRLREKLNIWAEGKAICDGESGRFLVDKNTREQVAKKCSFILLCEKQTVSRELLERLKAEGYKVNLVSTGGFSPTDVQEVALSLAEEMVGVDEPTFYFLVLHDFDLRGIEILFNIKEQYAGVIDVGVNSELIKRLVEREHLDKNRVAEQCLNKNYQGELKGKISEGDGTYSLEDFEYLQGVEQPNGKEWIGKRIEIDAIHVVLGIEPFINYINEKIEEECHCWDLTRIGVEEYGLNEPEEFSLDEPHNCFEDVIETFTTSIREKYSEKEDLLSIPMKNINTIVSLAQEKFLEDFWTIKRRFGISYNYDFSIQGKPLKQKYDEYLSRTYIENFQEDLDNLNGEVQEKYERIVEDKLSKINEQVYKYEGDVTGAETDLYNQHSDVEDELNEIVEGLQSECNFLQENLNELAENDPDLGRLNDELKRIDWGENELNNLEIPDEKEVIKTVIERLQERLKELEET